MVAQDEHVFSMVIIDGDNMPVSTHALHAAILLYS